MIHPGLIGKPGSFNNQQGGGDPPPILERSAIPPIKGELQMLRPLLLSLMLFVAGSFSVAADPKQEAENLVKTYEANFNKKDAAGIAACTPRTASELPIGAC